MNLWEDLIRGIYAYGFERPSAIQQRATKPIVNEHDVITQAQSGTGKTATISFAIMLQSVDMQLRDTQALYLLPTRELAVQIQMVVLALGDYLNVHCHACIGGTNLGEDLRKLDFGQHIVSGTSGRVIDMMRLKTLRTSNIKMLVLDEADEMLKTGFKRQIYNIYRFFTTKYSVDSLYEMMRASNFTVSSMHGDMPQKERDAIMKEFHSGQTIGCSGRFGRIVVAIIFVKLDDIKILRDIEHYYSTQIDEMPMNNTYDIPIRGRYSDICRLRLPSAHHSKFYAQQIPFSSVSLKIRVN